MPIRIYNTLTQEKEEFVPLEPNKVKMYVCGPTVYDFVHVGNFRGPIFFNLVRNWLEKSGFAVEYAYNYTDVDDRIIERSVREKVAASEIAEKFIAEFEIDFTTLKLRRHDHNPKATEAMQSIIEIISALIERDIAYVVDGEVLFGVRKFATYGKLSHKNIDDLLAGARVEVDRKKRDPMDFALWKPEKPGEPSWPSPWGPGRPGWHIECSAMIRAIFGDSVDIHGGGTDLIFPHHENEIAQSEGASGQPFAKYWMHNNMLTFGDRKMSKSLGNIKRAREFMSQYNPEILKYMMLSVHYRSLSDFSDASTERAVAGLARIYSALNLAKQAASAANGVAPSAEVPKVVVEAIEVGDREIKVALDDDFNTPEMFAAIYNVVRAFNGLVRLAAKVTPQMLKAAIVFREWVEAQGVLLSLFQEEPGEYLRKLDDMLLEKKNLQRTMIDGLVGERTAARVAKDFKRSDELRDQLVSLGIALQDSATGTSWEVQK